MARLIYSGVLGGVLGLRNLQDRTHYSISKCEKCKSELLRKVYRGLSSLSPKCWKCGSERNNSTLFCGQCSAIQKPDKKYNYFDILKIKTTFELEPSDLTSNYRKLQNVLHPDRFSNSDEEERNISEEYSSLVNKAYNTLSKPLARGLYMLELQGIHLEEGNVQSDPEFLMELMDRNEEVDQAKDYAEVASLDAKNKRMLEDLARNVAEAFNAGDLKKATDTLIKMKYYTSIDTKIKVLKQKDDFLE